MSKIKDKLKKLTFAKLKNLLRRKVIEYSSDPRPTNYPYLSGDSFRKICDHVYDETGKCSPQDIKEGQIVFVKSDYIKEFFENFHPLVKEPYKLVSHNSDYNITEIDLTYIDDKIIRWFGQNVKVFHTKLTPIPLGIDNSYYSPLGETKVFDKVRKLKVSKKNEIIFGFSVKTNPRERQPALDYLTQSKIANPLVWETDPFKYLSLINQYKFVACPSGNGLDDPRTWQTLYLKGIPIVTKSVAREYFKDLNIPLLIIERWQDLDNKTPEDLERIYNEIRAQSDPEEKNLFMDYWTQKIKNDE